MRAFFALTLFLFGVGYLWWSSSAVSRRSNSSIQRIVRSNEFEKLKEIRVQSDLGEFTLKRDSRAWGLVSAPEAELDPEKLNLVLNTIGALRSRNSLSPEEVSQSRDLLGFDAPSLSVFLSDGENVQEIRFGSKHPISGRRYLQLVSTEEVALVDDSAFSALHLGPEDLRDRQPFLSSREQVAEVAIEARDQKLYFLRQVSPGAWSVITENGTLAADGDFISRKLRELLLLRVKNFIDRDTPVREKDKVLSLKLRIFSALDRGTGKIETGESIRQIDFFELPAAPNAPVPQMRFFAQLVGSKSLFELERRFALDFLQGPQSFRLRRPLSAIRLNELRSICISDRVGSETSVTQRLLRKERDGSWHRLQGCQSGSTDLGGFAAAELSKLAQLLDGFPVISFVETETARGKFNPATVRLRIDFIESDEKRTAFVVGDPVSEGAGGGADLNELPRFVEFVEAGGTSEALASNAEIERLEKFIEGMLR